MDLEEWLKSKKISTRTYSKRISSKIGSCAPATITRIMNGDMRSFSHIYKIIKTIEEDTHGEVTIGDILKKASSHTESEGKDLRTHKKTKKNSEK